MSSMQEDLKDISKDQESIESDHEGLEEKALGDSRRGQEGFEGGGNRKKL